MGTGKKSMLVVVLTAGGLWMVCGMVGCAASRTAKQSEASTDDVDGSSHGDARPQPPPPSDPSSDPPEPMVVPVDRDDGPAMMVDPPEPDPVAGDPVVLMDPPPPPPPEVVHERAEGAAVLDFDPEEPRSWVTRLLCDKLRDCTVGGMELLTQVECEALMGGACATHPRVPEELVLPECIEAVEVSSCDDLPIALMRPACIESFAQFTADLVGATELRAEGESCELAAPCGDGLQCTHQSGGCGVCTPYAEIGDDCAGRPCRGGYCDPASLLCTPFLRAGEPCDFQTRCLTGCGADGRCSKLQPGRLPDPVYTGCRDDQVCGVGECVDGYCMPPRPLGVPCERDLQCMFGRCHEGVCATSASCELPGEGEYCTWLGMCQAPLACERGRCTGSAFTTPVGVGEFCGPSASCDTGYCVNGECALRPGGVDCQVDAECETGRCMFGLCVPALLPNCTQGS